MTSAYQPDPSATPSWEVLGAYLDGSVSQGTIHGYAVQIFDSSDRLLFARQAGVCAGSGGTCPSGSPNYTVDLPTSIASSSKWVTSTTVLAALEAAVRAGKYPDLSAALSVRVGDTTTCPGVSAKLAGITIRQLLSFTSGLIPDSSCVTASGSTLQDCACTILSESAAGYVDSPTAGVPKTNAHPPGTTYKYGASHHVVAGAMVEVLTGLPFATLYESLVKSPLGMSAEYRTPTNLAGSLHSSVSDYARFVGGIYHDGFDGTGKVLSKEAVAEQQKSQMPGGVKYLITPQPGLEYGLNNWRFCYTPYDASILTNAAQLMADPSCSGTHQTGHAGKGGFTPWIDLKRGFYGVYSMREPSSGGGADYTNSELALTASVRLYAGLIVDASKQ